MTDGNDCSGPSARSPRPTLKTLATETGLAVATVSRALNDSPEIGEATKQRVREVALRLGYQPNRNARRLRTGRTHVLSLMLMPEIEITSHTSRLIHALSAALRGTSYNLIVTPVFDDEDPLKPLRTLVESQSADAVIMNRVAPKDERVAFLADQGVPFVTHGRSDLGIAHPWYDYDNGRFAELAMEAFAARGRRKVLLVPPPQSQSYAQHIADGAARVARRHGMMIERLNMATIESPSGVIEGAVAARLAEGDIDAVLCASAAAALSAAVAAERRGLTLGEQIDIAGKESTPVLRRIRRRMIGVHENVTRAGTFLARAAITALENPSAPPLQHLDVPGPDAVDQGDGPV